MKINSRVVRKAEEGSFGLYDLYKPVTVATSCRKTKMCITINYYSSLSLPVSLIASTTIIASIECLQCRNNKLKTNGVITHVATLIGLHLRELNVTGLTVHCQLVQRVTLGIWNRQQLIAAAKRQQVLSTPCTTRDSPCVLAEHWNSSTDTKCTNNKHLPAIVSEYICVCWEAFTVWTVTEMPWQCFTSSAE